MVIWNSESNIADDDIRVVKFFFETDAGPGNVTTMVNRGVSIPSAKAQLLQEIIAMGGNYLEIEIVKYEILEILTGDSDEQGPFH